MSAPAFKFIPRGAILQDFLVGGKNIVLGFRNPEEYLDNPNYFGAAIGRVANRISSATLKNVNGQDYPLAANNGKCALHGGPLGWDKKDWRLVEKSSGGGKEVVVFALTSPHMEEGYPGTVECVVRYTQYKDGPKEVLEIDFEAKLVDGLGEDVNETVINLTNHSYFNIADGPTIAGTYITFPNSTNYLPVDEHGIPKNPPTIAQYPGIETNKPFLLTVTEPDIDDCFILNPEPSTIPLDTRSLPLKTAVQAFNPETKLHLEVMTTEPAFQFYTGKYIGIEARKDGSPERVARAGFCVEPSRYVDAGNIEAWKRMVLVKRGDVYGSRIVYKGWKDETSSSSSPQP
ncbi:aldose 1-epimerase [Peziza echinospora]|nr:aldose 1-epimerase [Peziza echinospora]